MGMPIEIPNLTDSQKLYKALVEHIAALSLTSAEQTTDIKKLVEVVITGNGEISLREQVRKHEEFIKDVKYWTRLIGGALLLQTLAFLVTVVIAVVRFLPVLEQLAKNNP